MSDKEFVATLEASITEGRYSEYYVAIAESLRGSATHTQWLLNGGSFLPRQIPSVLERSYLLQLWHTKELQDSYSFVDGITPFSVKILDENSQSTVSILNPFSAVYGRGDDAIYKGNRPPSSSSTYMYIMLKKSPGIPFVMRVNTVDATEPIALYMLTITPLADVQDECGGGGVEEVYIYINELSSDERLEWPFCGNMDDKELEKWPDPLPTTARLSLVPDNMGVACGLVPVVISASDVVLLDERNMLFVGRDEYEMWHVYSLTIVHLSDAVGIWEARWNCVFNCSGYIPRIFSKDGDIELRLFLVNRIKGLFVEHKRFACCWAAIKYGSAAGDEKLICDNTRGTTHWCVLKQFLYPTAS